MAEKTLMVSYHKSNVARTITIGREFGEWYGNGIDFIVEEIHLSINDKDSNFYDLVVDFENGAKFEEILEAKNTSRFYTNDEQSAKEFLIENLENREKEINAEEELENEKYKPVGL